MRKPFEDKGYKLTQGFGENPEMYKKFGLLGHNGCDWGLPVGTLLLAPIAGKVIEATNDPEGYGYYVKIENDKEGCVIAHFSKITVSVGFVLKEGDPLGLSGGANGAIGSGNSTGPHVHMGVYLFPRDRKNGYGGFIDPLPHIVEPVPVNTDPAYIRQLEVDRIKLWQERDSALTDLKLISDKLNDITTKYTALGALGITTTDDIQNERTTYEETILGLRKELEQVLDRNKQLSLLNAKKDEEDATAIDQGTHAIVENRQLKDQVAKVKETVGIAEKMDLHKLIEHLQGIMELASKAFAKAPSDFQPGSLSPVLTGRADSFWQDIVKATGIGIILSVAVWQGLTFFIR